MKLTKITILIIILALCNSQQQLDANGNVIINDDIRKRYITTTSGDMPTNTDTFPLLTSPHLIDSLQGNTRIQSYSSVIGYLPVNTQKLINDCAQINTEETRLFDPTCYLNVFETKVKTPMINAYNDVLTAHSKQLRNSLGCLTKATKTWGTSSDSMTGVINNDIATMVAQQTTYNTCLAKFSTYMIQMSLSRHRNFLPPQSMRDEASIKVQNVNTGFIYTSQEQSEVVANFKEYVKCLYDFNTNMNTKLLDVEGMIGKMPGCTGTQTSSTTTPTTTTTTTPSTSSTGGHRNLQNSSGGMVSVSNGQGTIPVYVRSPMDMGRADMNLVGQTDQFGRPLAKTVSDDLKNSLQTLTSYMKAKNSAQWTTLYNKITEATDSINGYKPKAALHAYVMDRVYNSKALKVEWNLALRGANCSSDYIYFCTAGKCTCLDNTCPNDLVGKHDYPLMDQNQGQTPVSNFSNYNGKKVPDSLYNQNVPKERIPNMTKNTLQSYLGQSNTPPVSQGNQGSQPGNTTPSTGHRLLQSTTTPNGPQLPLLNFGNQTDQLTDYYTASICINRTRYIYTEANTTLGGKQFDFASKNLIGAGDQQTIQTNSCIYSLDQGTQIERQNCRGQISTTCSNGLDQFCKITNLFPIMQKNPSLTSPYPMECDELNSDYKEQTCFQWITDRLMKGTIVFDTNGLFSLPMEIQKNIEIDRNGKKMRYLQSSTVVVTDTDPVLKDSKAAALPSKAVLNTSDINVDSATAVQTPNAAVYINDLNENTGRVTTGAEVAKISSFVYSLFGVCLILML
jgi:hypothetical protein